MIRVGILGTDSLHSRYLAEQINHRDGALGRRARVTAMWGEDRDHTRALGTELDVDVVDDPSDMAGDVDAMLLLNRYGDDHAKYWATVADMGVPVFVDKPLADTLDGALAMARSAADAGIALMSCSHFRFDPVITRSRVFPPVVTAMAAGPRVTGLVSDAGARNFDPSYYGIHVAEIFHAVMGPGIATVRAHRTPALDWAEIRYADGRTGSICLANNLQLDWRVHALDLRTWADLEFFCQPENYRGMAASFLDLVEFGRVDVPVSATMECLAVLHAVELSVAGGEAEIDVPALLAGSDGSLA